MALGGSVLDNSSLMTPTASGAVELQKRLDRVIQSKYSPDAVLIDAEFQILQFRGHTSAYLDPIARSREPECAQNGEGRSGAAAAAGSADGRGNECDRFGNPELKFVR